VLITQLISARKYAIALTSLEHGFASILLQYMCISLIYPQIRLSVMYTHRHLRCRSRLYTDLAVQKIHRTSSHFLKKLQHSLGKSIGRCHLRPSWKWPLLSNIFYHRRLQALGHSRIRRKSHLIKNPGLRQQSEWVLNGCPSESGYPRNAGKWNNVLVPLRASSNGG
jgi:hypothetical protein